jgi:chloride channel 3/4/5
MSFNPTEGARRCFFVKRNVMPADSIDLSHVLDRHVLALRPQVPLELVVSTFQKMVSHIYFLI